MYVWLTATLAWVFVGLQQVKLSATEYDLLKVLIHHAGLVRTHHQLIHELWGGTHYHDAVHLLRVTISNLRRKLACDPRILRRIVTEPGVGYRLRTEDLFLRLQECMPGNPLMRKSGMRRGRKSMSDEERQKVSVRMRKYWSARSTLT